MKWGVVVAVCVGALPVLSEEARAQSGAAWPQPVPQQRSYAPAPSGADQSEPANARLGAAEAAATGEQSVTVDTRVGDVRVNDAWTVATMSTSPRSQCPSDRYVYERERPKWATETGRLMLAMQQGATVRISFTCRNGYQAINAIQFLSPPPPSTARAQNRLRKP